MSDAKGPSFETQKKLITEVLNFKQLEKGDIWYLVDMKWYKQWKKYIGYEYWGDVVGDSSSHPGPIDNSALLHENLKLKENLLDELDYMLVPEEVWSKLVAWYGLMTGQEPVDRKVMEQGLFVKHRKVEVYLMELKLCSYRDMDQIVTETFSRGDTIERVIEVMRKLFQIPENKDVRLWNKYMTNTYEELTKPETMIQDEGLYQGQMLVIEDKNDDGTWQRTSPTSHVSAAAASAASSSTRGSVGSNTSAGSSNSNYYHTRQESGYTPAPPGVCGLSNLGNTCFMNSALQAMSNVPQLSSYFLSEKWRKELNPDNPLSCNGEMASAFAELIQTMWSGRHSYTMPRAFKVAVGHFAPQFSGYQQHDCQELMAFLLDGLHEDLNRIRKKPYIEIKDAEGRPDEVVAHEAWINYQKRNDSIIVDIFHGLLKSTLHCPKCDKISVTFDPFCYLSLPLPTKKDRLMEVFYKALDPSCKTIQYRISVPKEGTVADICCSLSRLVQVPANRLIVTDVYNHKFHKIFVNNELLTNISERDDIFVYEAKTEISEESDIFMLPVYFKLKTNESAHAPLQMFGTPILVAVPRQNCTYNHIYEAVITGMKRFVTLPENTEKWITSPSRSNDKKSSGYQRKTSEDPMDDKSKDPPIFTMSFVNSSGSNDIAQLDQSSSALTLSENSYLSLVWHPRAKQMFYKEDEAEDLEKDGSMYQKAIRRSHQLSDCIELFTKEEQLGEEDPWYCPKCKEHQQAFKKFDLWQLPPVLVVHLKRFSYNRFWRDKIDTMVDCPVSTLDMGEWVINKKHEGSLLYDLIAVCNHFGGLGGGHYTAYAKNKNNHKWYYFDDSNVSHADDDSVVNKAGYVLVYKRRNMSTGMQHTNGSVNGFNEDEDMDTN